MEAECIALSTEMRELILMKYVVQEVAVSTCLKLQNYSDMKNTVWEYNAGALASLKLKSPTMTPIFHF